MRWSSTWSMTTIGSFTWGRTFLAPFLEKLMVGLLFYVAGLFFLLTAQFGLSSLVFPPAMVFMLPLVSRLWRWSASASWFGLCWGLHFFGEWLCLYSGWPMQVVFAIYFFKCLCWTNYSTYFIRLNQSSVWWPVTIWNWKYVEGSRPNGKLGSSSRTMRMSGLFSL